MAKADQTLRAVLDHRGAPPRDKEERRYYESMMRRLGYTEAEMAKERVVEEPVVAAPQVAHSVVEDKPDTKSTRIIELEYGGAEEIPEFEPVRAKVHPTKVEPTEFDVTETPAVVEDDDNEFVLLVPDDEPEEAEGLVEFSESDDDELVEFTEARSEDWGNWDDEPEPALAAETAPPAKAPKPAKPAKPTGDSHGDYHLFRRELDGGQHVYFYSRKAPADAEPAQVPEGYGVKESEESGLPYLARVE